MDKAARIIESLEPMFKEAEAKGLWFWNRYQDIWVLPADLRANHAKGQFVWGPDNWELRDPGDRKITMTAQELGKFKDEAMNYHRPERDRLAIRIGELEEERDHLKKMVYDLQGDGIQ